MLLEFAIIEGFLMFALSVARAGALITAHIGQQLNIFVPSARILPVETRQHSVIIEHEQ